MLKIATLGPEGTNHELVSHRYMQFHDIKGYEIKLATDFVQAIDWLRSGEADYLIQCAVHPDTPATLGENFRDIFAVDSFISDSKQLAVLSRKDVEAPETLGILLPANGNYTDTRRWKKKISRPSLPLLFDMLLTGEVDSALVYLECAERYPELIRVDEVIGSPDDVWIVYGMNKKAISGQILGSRIKLY